MSERIRRSSRLQDKRTKLVAKVRRKSCRIVDDDSSSDNQAYDGNDSITSNNASLIKRKNRIGSLGGNFTTV